jgi:hypothetical protein
MKTKAQLDEIKMSAIKNFEDFDPKKETVKQFTYRQNKQNNYLEWLKQMSLYVETNPRPEFIAAEIERLQTKIDNIDKKGGDKKENRRIFGYDKIRSQLKTLKFIAD